MSIKNFSKVFLFFAVIILLLNCGGGGDSPTLTNSTTGSISGVATTGSSSASFSPKFAPGSSGNVLSGAEVYVVDYDGNSYGPVTTGANGSFTVTGVPTNKTNFIIKIKKDKIILRTFVNSITAGSVTNVGQVDITTTAMVHLIEKRIKEETGQNITLGDTGNIASAVKNKITNINMSQEKINFKNSIEGDTTSSNPIYVVYATIVAITETANNIGGFSLNEFLNDPTKNISVVLGDTINVKNNEAIDTGIKNVKTVSSIKVTPDSIAIYQDSTVQFTVIANYTNGDTENITDSAIYQSTLGIINRGLFYANNDTGTTKLFIKYFGYIDLIPINISFNSNNIIKFQKLFGSNNNERIWSIQQTSDNYYWVCGFQNNQNSTGYIGKFDMNGNNYISYTDTNYEIYELIPDNNNIIYVSSTYDTTIIGSPNTSNLDYYICKIDQNFNVLWKKRYGTSGYDYRADIIKSNDNNGYIISGMSFMGAGIYTIKINLSGDTVWEKSYINGFTVSDIVSSNDSGYLISATHNSDIVFIKINENGDTIFEKKYGGSGIENVIGPYGDGSLRKTADGGYIFACYSTSTNIANVTNNGGNDILVIKIDANGDTQWIKMYGGSGDEYGASIQQLSDGSYLIASISNSQNIPNTSNKGGYDVLLTKIDSSGNVLWHKLYGGSGNEGGEYPSYYFLSMIKTNDNGYIIATSSNSSNISGTSNNGGYDVYIIKMDSVGNIE